MPFFAEKHKNTGPQDHRTQGVRYIEQYRNVRYDFLAVLIGRDDPRRVSDMTEEKQSCGGIGNLGVVLITLCFPGSVQQVWLARRSLETNKSSRKVHVKNISGTSSRLELEGLALDELHDELQKAEFVIQLFYEYFNCLQVQILSWIRPNICALCPLGYCCCVMLL